MRNSHYFFLRIASAFTLMSIYALTALAADTTLFAFSKKPLFDGKYGKVAGFQKALNRQLINCGLSGIQPDGVFGQGTQRAIIRATQCADVKSKLSPASRALQGEVTSELWALINSEVSSPTVQERAQTMVLTYEATDYDRLEWNFCQNRPLWNTSNPGGPCYTNDPGSFITWGPRGATAGGGREVQWILWRIEQANKSILDTAFGVEAESVRRLLNLDSSSAKRLLCSIFTDTTRKTQWTNGFKALGEQELARKMFDDHYLSAESDGSKVRSFYRLYEQLGLAPTEVDYGFFLDRATHSSVPSMISVMQEQVLDWLKQKGAPKNPVNIRRAFAEKFPTTSQTEDRLGRDVAFYIDAVGIDGLTAAEKTAWQKRGQIRASDVGLSDGRLAPVFQNPPSVAAKPTFVKNDTDFVACPLSIMNPLKP